MARPQSEKHLRNIAIILLLQLAVSTVGLYAFLTLNAIKLHGILSYVWS